MRVSAVLNAGQSYITRFHTFLSEVNWHEALIPIITTFLESRHIETDIDNLLMQATKKVEMILRNSIQQLQGSSERLKVGGIKLLDYAVHYHLIKNKEDPLYSLIYWILKEPRNTSHHTFKIHPFNELVLIVLQVDKAIRELTNRLKSNYDARMRITVDPEKTKIKIRTKVFRPNKTVLPDTEKVEAHMRYSNGRIVTLDLKPNGNGYRYGEYDYRGNAAGTISLNYRGINGNKRFLTSSASTVTIFPIDRRCPECGKEIEYGKGTCQNCGTRIYII